MQKFQNPDTLNSVAAFHRMFEHVILDEPGMPDMKTRVMRINLISEELTELADAIAGEDPLEIADALADLQYVLTGTILSFGFGGVFKQIFEEVQRSNMSKACTTLASVEATLAKYQKDQPNEEFNYKEKDGAYLVYRVGDGKTVKAVDYSPANIAFILFKNTLKPGQVWLEYNDNVLLHAWLIVNTEPLEFPNSFDLTVMDESGWLRNFTSEHLHAHCGRVETAEHMVDMEEKARVIALQRQYEQHLKREKDSRTPKAPANTVGEEMLKGKLNSAHGHTEGSDLHLGSYED